MSIKMTLHNRGEVEGTEQLWKILHMEAGDLDPVVRGPRRPEPESFLRKIFILNFLFVMDWRVDGLEISGAGKFSTFFFPEPSSSRGRGLQPPHGEFSKVAQFPQLPRVFEMSF